MRDRCCVSVMFCLKSWELLQSDLMFVEMYQVLSSWWLSRDCWLLSPKSHQLVLYLTEQMCLSLTNISAVYLKGWLYTLDQITSSFLLVGSQISCFPPTNFSLRQAMYVDSFCWVVAGSHTSEDGSPLWLHKVMLPPNLCSCHRDTSWHVFCCFSVLSLHPSALGRPRVCSCSVLALHCCSSALLRPQFHYGGAGSLLQPLHPLRQELGVQQHWRQGHLEGFQQVWWKILIQWWRL